MRKGLIHEILADAAWNFPHVEIVSGNIRSTYAKEWERVLQVAAGLHQLGVSKGTVIGVLDVNSYRYFELQFAVSLLGAIIHPLNFRLPMEDLAYTVQHARDDVLFVHSGFQEVGIKLRPYVKHFIWMDEAFLSIAFSEHSENDFTFEQVIALGQTANLSKIELSTAQLQDTDIYSVFYTTGTTGRPKGMQYRHRDLLHASLQIAHHLTIHETGARLAHGATIFPLIPFFHIHGWGTPFFAPYLGAKLVLPERANVKEQLALIKQEKVSWSNMVPTQLHMLLNEVLQEQEQQALLALRILTGGSALPSGLASRANALGIEFSLIYGGSDQLATGISALLEPALTSLQKREILSTRIVPLPMVKIDIRGIDGQTVPKDGHTIGEVYVQSPWLPDGYLNDEKRSQSAYIDGWFRTGDLAVWHEDHTFHVLDRQKDAVKSGGEWIATSVIEAVLSELEGVNAVAVIAQTDEHWGERPIAVIESSTSLSTETVRDHLLQAVQAGRLAKFWIPDRILFIPSMPMTSAGKIHKAVLRQQLAEQIEDS
ncbi:AMP-binding protein [Sulfoacidibacillus thermotolerans]|uniref:AMP-dependent synthetase n=1 Tax=Sulfoacidibacillus thermotolerans TaxID=1765684 RepID=A0A2U3DBQ7_SULT2|nr:AMP-binding protein [Sulfoacidibacillus thermotolerans]PWI58721.1 AMP-dependent synthetase [Sulfoacidibacillus thermotolerans]